ncbi:Ketoreductase [Lachnellula suecica]|uniref:Ketoreductase n=1 Tax=Lachnellula suecica TaxID=602035 RepID=A0A8T9CGD9_9HELO|nr:Ketoreductase [Lachnellula suecica]
MSTQEIFLTGATGGVGATVLDQLLAKGYKVNAAIRSAKKSQPFLEQKYPANIANNTLKLTEIPDMTVPHVFDEPARTADAIIHVATPLADSDFEHTMIQPTWAIDEGILIAAAKSPKVKRVIITGTIGSTVNMSQLFQDGSISEKSWNSTTHEEALQNLGNAYSYSKTTAEKKAWAFMEAEKPKFDLVVLLAPLIIGKSIQHGFVPTKDALGGMANIYKAIFDVPEPGFIFPPFMDIGDVAAIHLKSLDPKIPGNERYLFEADGQISGPLLAAKVREVFPQLQDRVPAPKDDTDGIPTPFVKRDTSKADTVFGPKAQWKDWWTSAKDTVEDIIHLEAKA